MEEEYKYCYVFEIYVYCDKECEKCRYFRV